MNTEPATSAVVPASGGNFPPTPAAGQTLRERRHWIVNPAGHPYPGTYKIRFKQRGPYVPVRLAFEKPCDPWTGEELDRSLRWVMQVGHTQQHYFASVDMPILAGEPVEYAEYCEIWNEAGWRDEWADQNELQALNR